MVKVDMFEMWRSYLCAPLLHDMLLDDVSSTWACYRIFHGSLISIARKHHRQSFRSQLIYIEWSVWSPRWTMDWFFSITQGHIHYNGTSQRNFGNKCLSIFMTCVLCCSTILPPTQEFRFEKKKKKTSSNRWCARGCWFAPITNRGKGGWRVKENCWHLFMGNSFMVQSRAKAFVLKKLWFGGMNGHTQISKV